MESCKSNKCLMFVIDQPCSFSITLETEMEQKIQNFQSKTTDLKASFIYFFFFSTLKCLNFTNTKTFSGCTLV